MKNSGKTWLVYVRNLDEETGEIYRTRHSRHATEAEARQAARAATEPCVAFSCLRTSGMFMGSSSYPCQQK